MRFQDQIKIEIKVKRQEQVLLLPQGVSHKKIMSRKAKK